MAATVSPTMTSAGMSRQHHYNDLSSPAERLYAQAARRPWWTVAHEVLSGRKERLQMLGAIPVAALSSLRQEQTTRDVPLAQIVGSYERARSQDFDPAFRPVNYRLKERWLSVAARRLAGCTLPPVALIQTGARYFVVDGHHRVSVERALGSTTIPAHVIWVC